MQKSKIYTINNDLLTKLEETTINEGVFVEIRNFQRKFRWKFPRNFYASKIPWNFTSVVVMYVACMK